MFYIRKHERDARLAYGDKLRRDKLTPRFTGIFLDPHEPPPVAAESETASVVELEAQVKIGNQNTFGTPRTGTLMPAIKLHKTFPPFYSSVYLSQ